LGFFELEPAPASVILNSNGGDSSLGRKKEKDTFFIPPKGGGAAEVFLSLFSHTDGKIRDGYGAEGRC
jgi:hypothetical protein